MSVFSNELAWLWADLLGYDADHKLQLVIELKSHAHIQSGVVDKAKQWLQEVGRQRPELYALFITPEFILLRLPATLRHAKPYTLGIRHLVIQTQLLSRVGEEIDYAIDADMSLDFAIDTKRVSLSKLGPTGLQRVVESWLESCLVAPADDLQQQPAQAWLVESGLHQTLHNGRIKPPVGGTAMYAFAS